MVVEQPVIKEVDINPLMASGERLIALDARVVLHDPSLHADRLPRPAIRPYPSEYVWTTTVKNGAAVTIRPIRPEDEPLLVRLHETLSERTVYLRYLEHLKLDQRIAHQRLARLAFIDYDREMALVAENGGAIVGVGRLSRNPLRRDEAEFALLVTDAFQGQGLGLDLLKRLLDVARAEGIRRVTAEMLPDNGAMQAVCKKLGFRLTGGVSDPTVKAVIDL
jgi:acetyltransferase